MPGGWSVKNAQTGHCDRVGGKAGDSATQDACNSWSQAILVPLLDATSGVSFKSGPTGTSSFNINYTLAQRKTDYDGWFREKWDAEAKKIHKEFATKDQTLGNERYQQTEHKECGPQFDPAVIAYKKKHERYFAWKRNNSWQKCVPFVPIKTTHIACPPPEPPRKITTCQIPYGSAAFNRDIGWSKEKYVRYKNLYPDYVNQQLGCRSVNNNAHGGWLGKYSWINRRIRNGETCGPTGTLTRTTGGQRSINTCIPPAPTSTKAYCGMTFGAA